MVKVRSNSAPETLRTLAVLIVLGLFAMAPQTARAQTALQPTQILIGAPPQAEPGASLTVQALLADSQGHPISHAVIYFTAQEAFLHSSSDVVLAQAVTNGNGQAVAHFVDTFSGAVTLQAEFRGDTEYAPSTGTTPLASSGGQQVYAEHVGVDIPGLNVPPFSRSTAALRSPLASVWSRLSALWPAMNGWPLAAALLLVWSTYFFAVTFVFRVAALSGSPDDASADPRRSL